MILIRKEANTSESYDSLSVELGYFCGKLWRSQIWESGKQSNFKLSGNHEDKGPIIEGLRTD